MAKDKAKHAAYMRRWRRNHPDRHREFVTNYRATHREHIRDYARTYLNRAALELSRVNNA